MWDLPTYVVGDLSLYLKEAGSLKEIIFLTYLWVNLNILDWERNKSHSKQWVLVDWPSRFFLTYNWSCTSIIYMPTEHNSVTHHLARSSDKVCLTDCCQSSQIYTTHTATKNTNWTKPNQTKPNEENSENLRYSNSSFSVTLHSLGVLTCSFLLHPNYIFLVLARRA